MIYTETTNFEHMQCVLPSFQLRTCKQKREGAFNSWPKTQVIQKKSFQHQAQILHIHRSAPFVSHVPTNQAS